MISVSYRDMDATPLGVEKGATPFLVLPATLTLPLRIPGIREASLSTGANIVSGSAYDGIVDDWTKYLHTIDEKLASAVDHPGVLIAEGLWTY